MTNFGRHRPTACRCQHCRATLLRRANAARNVMKTDPYADPLLLLSYVVWPGPIEREYLAQQAAA